MESFKKRWQRTPKSVRLPVVFIIGWIVVIVGLIDLPLPGPGWVIIFVGFAILASEFAHAKKTRDWMVARLKAFVAWLRRVARI